MRERRVWRYYCDFCKKAGCGKAAMMARWSSVRITRNPYADRGGAE